MAVLTPVNVRALLSEHKIRPSRALGQNFLVDPNTARRIARLADVEHGDRVLEIGPGLGSLTVALVDAGAHVVALELDRHMLPALHQVVEGGDVEVVHGDALTADFGVLLGVDSNIDSNADPNAQPWTCVSNLPYNVATPVVARILDDVPQVTRLLVMVQREVGERLAAPPGSSACGPVSVKVQYYAHATVVATVPPTVFHPRPKVDSALVRIDRRSQPPVDVDSPEALFALARAGFGQRRKMLRQALRSVLGNRVGEVLERAGVSPTARAETLDLYQWAALCREANR